MNTDIEKIPNFAVNYIHNGGSFTRQILAAGIFYACTTNIFGPAPPCAALMRPLPLWCSSTGKAGPSYIFCLQLKYSEMNYTELNSVEQDLTKKILNFFSANEIESITDSFKIIFQMAAFETVNDHQDREKNALYQFYTLIEILNELKIRQN